MKFSCTQENLSRGMQVVGRAVPAKALLPILSNILLTAKDGRLRLAATNTETTIITFIPASVEQEGATAVPAKFVKEVIQNLSPSTIAAKLDRDILHIHSDKTKTKLNGTSHEEYPELPEFPKDKNTILINSGDFATAVSLVAFAAGMDETRPVFSGVYLSYDEGKLTLAATDGYRLSEKVIPAKGGKKFTALIPAKTLLEVGRIFMGSPSDIRFALSENENTAFFESDDTFIATRILDGQYPDYKRIVPQSSTLTSNVLLKDLEDAVKLTNIFTKEKSNSPIRISFDSQGKIKVASIGDETGHHESEVLAEVDGNDLEVALNSKYLIDLLTNIKTEKITFECSGATSPCLFKTSEHPDFIHIVMPVQV